MIDLCAQKECVTVKIVIHQFISLLLNVSTYFYSIVQNRLISSISRTYTIIIILHFTLFIFINSMNKTVTISVLICVARRKDIFHFIAKLNKLYCLQKVWKGFWAVSLNFFQPYLQTTMKAESFVLGFSHEINLDC